MDASDDWPPIPIGALLRFGLHEIRRRIYEGVRDAGFDDLRAAHVTLFRWPGPDGRRPTEIATDVQLSKQRVNDLLRELEALGYLGLDPDPSDNRARTVRLSTRGRALHEIAVAVHARVEDEWAQVVGEARYRSARATLAELVATLPGAPPHPSHGPPGSRV
jgi:DNA-binding MarR family transcriptional regulator